MKKTYNSPTCNVLEMKTVAMIADSSTQGDTPVVPVSDTPASPKTTTGLASNTYEILAKPSTTVFVR